jgi:hypothetical protein
VTTSQLKWMIRYHMRFKLVWRSAMRKVLLIVSFIMSNHWFNAINCANLTELQIRFDYEYRNRYLVVSYRAFGQTVPARAIGVDEVLC